MADDKHKTYTTHEYADINFHYGKVNGVEREAQKLVATPTKDLVEEYQVNKFSHQCTRDWQKRAAYWRLNENEIV